MLTGEEEERMGCGGEVEEAKVNKWRNEGEETTIDIRGRGILGQEERAKMETREEGAMRDGLRV